MFFEDLTTYKINGSFSFKPTDSLNDKCNAPTDTSGIYLIFKIVRNEEILIYIGSSGQKKDGKIKHRKGGIKDRLVNGYHPNRFGQDKRISRRIAFSRHMLSENIAELRIYWWVTHNDREYSDFPTAVEKMLTTKYHAVHKRLPDWHKQ